MPGCSGQGVKPARRGAALTPIPCSWSLWLSWSPLQPTDPAQGPRSLLSLDPWRGHRTRCGAGGWEVAAHSSWMGTALWGWASTETGCVAQEEQDVVPWSHNTQGCSCGRGPCALRCGFFPSLGESRIGPGMPCAPPHHTSGLQNHGFISHPIPGLGRRKGLQGAEAAPQRAGAPASQRLREGPGGEAAWGPDSAAT